MFSTAMKSPFWNTSRQRAMAAASMFRTCGSADSAPGTPFVSVAQASAVAAHEQVRPFRIQMRAERAQQLFRRGIGARLIAQRPHALEDHALCIKRHASLLAASAHRRMAVLYVYLFTSVQKPHPTQGMCFNLLLRLPSASWAVSMPASVRASEVSPTPKLFYNPLQSRCAEILPKGRGPRARFLKRTRNEPRHAGSTGASACRRQGRRSSHHGSQQLILNRYRPIAEAGAGGFGTVQVAWDTRIQRKVAIKCIELDEFDAMRAQWPDAGTHVRLGADGPPSLAQAGNGRAPGDSPALLRQARRRHGAHGRSHHGGGRPCGGRFHGHFRPPCGGRALFRP